jgi:hypothetical protein
MSTTAAVVLIVVIAIAAIGMILIWQRENRRKLRARFGPEYDRVAREQGTWKGETILRQREKRISTLPIHSLSNERREQFAARWRSIQERFVDDPHSAVEQADHLIDELLKARGYPATDFEQQTADLSVEHARVVDHYRTAHDIAVRDRASDAGTEDLRLALQHYRALFEELLEMSVKQ